MSVNRLLIIFLLAITSVPSTLAEDTYSKKDKPKTILNPVHSNKVQDVMRRLKLLFYEREYTDLELQELTRKQIELLVEETNTLVGIAKEIDLTDEDQLTFNAMANQIHELTLELEEKFHHQSDLIPTYIKMQETCNTCHQIFRNR